MKTFNGFHAPDPRSRDGHAVVAVELAPVDEEGLPEEA